MSDLLFKLLAAGAFLGAVYAWHRSEVADEVERINAKATEQRRAEVAEFVVDMSARNLKLREQNEADKRARAENTKTLVERIPTYVSRLSDSRCVIPRGFVQHYGAAWDLSALPAAAGRLVDEPAGVLLSDVERANTCNAGAALEWRAEAIAWRNWWTTERAKFDAFAARTADPRGNGGKPETISKPAR